MTATLLKGKELAERLKPQISRQVAEIKAIGCTPRLVAVEVGQPAASKLYVRSQMRACDQVGIAYELADLPIDATEAELCDRIRRLNADPAVSGVIVQMPLPVQIDIRKVQEAIDPAKDVEGIHPLNYGRLFGMTGHVAPCTALAAVELVRSTGEDHAGKEAVIVGHSEIVGKPIAMILLQSLHAAPTVTVCHVATRDLAAHTRKADILFVATGCRQRRWEKFASHATTREHPPLPDLSPLISADMVKPGATVIDVAINRIPAGFDSTGRPILDEQGKVKVVTVGDVDFDAVKEVARYITPVPGGVGPLTAMMLMRNTIACAKKQASRL